MSIVGRQCCCRLIRILALCIFCLLNSSQIISGLEKTENTYVKENEAKTQISGHYPKKCPFSKFLSSFTGSSPLSKNDLSTFKSFESNNDQTFTGFHALSTEDKKRAELREPVRGELLGHSSKEIRNKLNKHLTLDENVARDSQNNNLLSYPRYKSCEEFDIKEIDDLLTELNSCHVSPSFNSDIYHSKEYKDGRAYDPTQLYFNSEKQKEILRFFEKDVFHSRVINDILLIGKCHTVVFLWVHHLTQESREKFGDFSDSRLPLLPAKGYEDVLDYLVSHSNQGSFQSMSSDINKVNYASILVNELHDWLKGTITCQTGHAAKKETEDPSNPWSEKDYPIWPYEVHYYATGYGQYPFWTGGPPSLSQSESMQKYTSKSFEPKALIYENTIKKETVSRPPRPPPPPPHPRPYPPSPTPRPSNDTVQGSSVEVWYSSAANAERYDHSSCSLSNIDNSLPDNVPCTHLFLDNSYSYLFSTSESFCCYSSTPTSFCPMTRPPRDFMNYMTKQKEEIDYIAEDGLYKGKANLYYLELTEPPGFYFWYVTNATSDSPLEQGEGPCLMYNSKGSRACTGGPIMLFHQYHPDTFTPQHQPIDSSIFSLPAICQDGDITKLPSCEVRGPGGSKPPFCS